MIKDILALIPESIWSPEDQESIKDIVYIEKKDKLLYMCSYLDSSIIAGPIITGSNMENYTICVMKTEKLIWLKSIQKGKLIKLLTFNSDNEISGEIYTKNDIIKMKNNKVIE